MTTLKRIYAVSCAKLMAIMYALLGLLLGVIFSLFGATASMGAGEGAGMMAGFGALSIVVFPLLYGAMGFIGGLIMAWLYNFAARFAGGIQVETE